MKGFSTIFGSGLLLFSLSSLNVNADENDTLCEGLLDGTPPDSMDTTIPDEDEYNTALATLNLTSVFMDLFDFMTDSQDCWPADEFNGEESYAGLMLRLAWHCAGTFREGDMEGGCAGGRQRYLPESAWADNANLDKARALLAPIKEEYGDALSWGDLFVFAGTAAILQGGGPVTEVCAGRIDDTNGTKSDVLNVNTTCHPNGNCSLPLGSSTVGLIYVNAQGFLGVPNRTVTAPHIREVFSRMGMNDSETVALIGGGHAFGKAHGACTNGSGPGPEEQPYDPWPGLCGDNFPEDTFTSGIEGQWTKYPFEWDNEYFTQLINDSYTLGIGSGGAYQWTNDDNGYLMLTTDLALVEDSDYYDIVMDFANDIDSLNTAFSNAWEKLVTGGGRWADNKFCVSADDLPDGDSSSSSESSSESNDDDDDSVTGLISINNKVTSLCLVLVMAILNIAL